MNLGFWKWICYFVVLGIFFLEIKYMYGEKKLKKKKFGMVWAQTVRKIPDGLNPNRLQFRLYKPTI
jgi:hypothetical protein